METGWEAGRWGVFECVHLENDERVRGHCQRNGGECKVKFTLG